MMTHGYLIGNVSAMVLYFETISTQVIEGLAA